nr:helix-turn-helix domain-containing protein [Intestinimonas timonensis]
MYQSQQINTSELARLSNISRPTVYRYLACIKEDTP